MTPLSQITSAPKSSLRATVTAAVFTYNNEGPLLKKVLQAIEWVDEVIVVDMESTDETRTICAKFTDKIFVHNENESINSNFNFGYQQASSEYIVHISSDFLISDDLKNEITQVLSAPSEQRADIYEARITNYYFGKPVRLSVWEKTRIPLLFKKGMVVYPTFRLEVWPKLFSARKALLKNRIEHYTVARITDLVQKYNRYSDIEVRNHPEIFPLVKNPLLLGFFGFGNACYNYFFRGGFKYGMHGFIVCVLQGFYYFLQRAKRWERDETEKQKGIWDSKVQTYE